MKPHLVFSLCVLLSLVVLHSIVHAQNPPGWNQGAENVEWEWDEHAASPFGSMDHINSKYGIRLLFKKGEGGHHLHISVLEGERAAFTFEGHSRTVYDIQDDRLYYSLFDPFSSGAKIVAVDLTTGKELWRSELHGIGVRMHSAYSNALNLSADRYTVKVFGNELSGQYFESKRADTGVTTAHKIFSSDETDPQIIAVRKAVYEYYNACRMGSLPYVKRLLEAGIGVNARCSERFAIVQGQAALHCAAEKGAPSVIEYLLEQGHPVDPKDSDDMTPLLIAIQSAEKAKKAERGVAEPEVLSETGLTELQGALQSCQILIQHGAALPESWRAPLRKMAQAAGKKELVNLIEHTPLPGAAKTPKPPKP